MRPNLWAASLLLATPLLLAGPSLAEDKAPPPPASSNSRPARKVGLVVGGTLPTEIDYPAREAVVADAVNLVPGEKFLIEAEVRGAKLAKLKLVEKARHPERTLEVEFSQNLEQGSPFMVLRVKNPFSQPITYEAGIQAFGGERIDNSDTVPVKPGQESLESWPQPLTRIVLRSFRLGDAPKAAAAKKK